MTKCLKFVKGALVAGMLSAAALFASNAGAQAYPNKPLRLILPLPPGSAFEVTLRAITSEASTVMGQTIVFENKPGASSRLGIVDIRKAPGDGYLLTIASDSVLIAQALGNPTFQIEQGKDYVPAAFLIEFPLVLAGRAGLPFKDMAGLVQYAKANPGKLNWATSPGTLFLTERLRQVTGMEVTTVPYKGGTEPMMETVAGRVDVLLYGPDVAPFFASGKLVGIATSGPQRWKVFPNIPTFTESGTPVANTIWYGVVVPPGTPADIIAKVNSSFNAALKTPAVTSKLDTNGFFGSRFPTPKEFGTFIQTELEAWGPVIKKSGIKLE